MNEALLRIVTSGLLAAAGIAVALGSGVAVSAHANAAEVLTPGHVHSRIMAAPADDQWG
ncbi:hypothetical protein AB0F77_32055 [Streptomyces sp. NPDC026672]|uniref:hypothetical protein n=1 Tax=unclassified Streptomyces TaxID=2593676 RepID=UPI0033E8FBE9